MEVMTACSAKVRQRGSARFFRSLSTDSRHIKKGNLFFALAGPHFDGHSFVKETLRKGATGAVIQKGRRPQLIKGSWIFAVDDVQRSLGDIAAWWRQRFSIPVIGITGSNGKTTTKELIAEVLSTKHTVLKTLGNFNNLIGLPLTINRLNHRHHIAVLEMGMNAPGEIDRLAEIAQPQIGVITNIARAHLEGLGSLGVVTQAKGELISRLPSNGLALLNSDDPRVLKLAKRSKAPVLTYGFNSNADIRGYKLKTDSQLRSSFEVALGRHRIKVSLDLTGRHNASNALAAIAIGHHFKIPIPAMKQAIKRVTLPSGRMQRIHLPGGVLLLNDSYNANPDSVLQALKTVSCIKKRRKIIVLGDMLELGPYSRRAHHEIGREAVRAGAHELVAVGQWAEAILSGAHKAGLPIAHSYRCRDANEAGKLLKTLLKRGDLILIKGSRGIALDNIIKYLNTRRAA